MKRINPYYDYLVLDEIVSIAGAEEDSYYREIKRGIDARPLDAIRKRDEDSFIHAKIRERVKIAQDDDKRNAS